MAKTLEKEVVAAIELTLVAAQKRGKNPDLHGIAAIFNCTYQSVCYIRRRIEKLQQTGVDDRKMAGRKPSADRDKVAEAVKDLLERTPGLDQKAICEYIFDELGVKICQATVSRMLRRNEISHKVSNRLYRNSRLVTASGRASIDGQTSKRAKGRAPLSTPTTLWEIHESIYDSVNAMPQVVTRSSVLVTSSSNVKSTSATIVDSGWNHDTAGIEGSTTYSSPYL
jgi:transposase